MKFMKLGSKPDTFYTAEAVRSVSSEVSSDIIIQVKGNRYLLHKFPLLSKCLRLQKLCAESPDSPHHQIVQLTDFPGSEEAFELCAKFCYGITITLSAYNVVAVRCAADYLQMTEEVEKGNLISKIETFFNSCILLGWKDSIVTLQTTKSLPTWCEDLGITSSCIEAIASKVLAHPSKVSLSHSYSRRGSSVFKEAETHKETKNWWGEDIAELQIDLYWRTMIAIKSGGKVPSSLIGEALQIYACCWFPSKQSAYDVDPETALSNHKLLLESIVSLLPSEKGSVPCSFLLKLLKAANKLGASSSSKMELARRAGIQLEEATVKDLLIPPAYRTNDATKYDVDVVMSILEQFLSQGQTPPTSPPRLKGRFERRRRSRSAENNDLLFEDSRRSSSASHGSKLKVAKLIDAYLQEISHDPNLPLSKMISIAESIPNFARIDHDYLYKAIDTYLKAHPSLNKSERKRLCRILDCKKLSMEACMHAAQNERLPLRLVVQVLFHEHARASMASNKVADLPAHIKALLAAQDDDNASSRHPTTSLSTADSVAVEDRWSVSGLKSSSKSKISTLKTRLAEDEVNGSDGLVKASKLKAFCSIPSRPKKMFSKLMSMNRTANEKH
ncbi:hypothetical protein V2J09_019930 [Rumex salicifolius]